jgi:hypothetical protein
MFQHLRRRANEVILILDKEEKKKCECNVVNNQHLNF